MDREMLIAATRVNKPEVLKTDFITERTRGQTVLDIGCVDHSLEKAEAQGEHWLHSAIAAGASEVVGVDHAEEAVGQLVRQGFDIRVCDVQAFDLQRSFDVIVAGDIVEHLSSVEGFLSSARQHMTQDSILIITTPNPFNIEQCLRILAGGVPGVNHDHVAWLDPLVIWQLLDRHDFDIIEFAWVDARKPQLRGNRRLRWIAEAAMRWRPAWRRDFAVTAVLRPG